MSSDRDTRGLSIRVVPSGDAAALSPKPLGKFHAQVSGEDLLALKADAERRGRAEGVAQSVEALSALIARQRQCTEDVQDTLATLAIELAGHLVGQALVEHPAVFSCMVRNALALAAGHEEIVLRVHPEDLTILAADRALLCEAAQGALEFKADPSVPRKSARIDTARGRIDCDLQGQLDALARNMGVARWSGAGLTAPGSGGAPES